MKLNYLIELQKIYNEPEYYFNEFKNYKDDIYFWQSIVKLYKPLNIIEIGIGNGRLIKILHNFTKEYYGIDFSKKIIDYFNKKYEFKNVYLYNVDVTKISINKKFQMIILPFNVINNFYDKTSIKKLIKSIKKISKKNSVIVIDTDNYKNDKTNKKYKYCRSFMKKGLLVKVYEKSRYDKLNFVKIYHKKYTINGKIVKKTILPSRIYNKNELIDLFAKNDFELQKIYGDYNFEKFINISSRKILLIFKRR